MLKDASLAGNARSSYSSCTTLKDLTLNELAVYQKLQATLSKKQYLVHLNLARQLYIDIDASKEREMSAIIFHLKALSISNFFSCNNIEPIMFLLCLLMLAKTRYWPTKIEMAGLV